MGLSRSLISMLALDVARYENSSKEGVLQAFHQLNANSVLRERLAGAETQEAFRNIVSAFLVNESVYMPLLHMVLPLEWNGKMLFSELWVDPDAEENLKRGKGNQDNTIRFLFKIDIQGLGFFDMVLTCQRENVDLQLYCPQAVTPFAGIVQGEMSRILSENGMKPGAVQVQAMKKPLAISTVFPRIFEGENSINVKA